MISFFRRALSSWIVLALLALIAVAFIVTGIGTPTGLGDVGSGNNPTLAKVGDARIDAREAGLRVQTQLEAARQETPGLDMTAFVAQGGVERTLDQMINARAIEEFAEDEGLVASKRLVDGAIASIPAFFGPNGKFDRTAFLRLLDQRKLTEAQVRGDFSREIVTKALLIPVTGVSRPATGMVAPYAELLLEARTGRIATLPTTAFMSSAAPSNEELATFYQRNIARYTVPERRVIRIATLDRDPGAPGIQPTEAELQAAYKQNAATYAGRELRRVTQVIVPTQAAADALATRIKGGTPIADAARAAKLEPIELPANDRAAFAKLTSKPVADAVFATAKGAVAPVARSGLGFHVARVEEITGIEARPFASVRNELIAQLTSRKADEAIAERITKIEDAIADGATFEDLVKTYGLAAATTPPLTAGGLAPDMPDYRAPPFLAPVLRDAFQGAADDDPAVVTISPESHVLFDLDRIVAAAPRPLASIRNEVLADAAIDRANRAARRAADAIVAAVSKGTPIDQALAKAAPALPAPRAAFARRIDIAQSQTPVPPPVELMFKMVQGRGRALAMADNAGWYVVQLDKIEQGDKRQAAPLVQATQAQLARVVGDEYAAQFVEAIKKKVGVTRNDEAIARFKASLTGAAPAR